MNNESPRELSINLNGGDSDCQPIPPMRVAVAIRFLNDITYKTMTKGFPAGEFKFEIVEGQKLTPTEVNAQMHACSLLIDYFRGTLQPNAIEQLELKEIENEVQEVARPVIRCPSDACNAKGAQKNCRFCAGTGYCLVVPSNGERGE